METVKEPKIVDDPKGKGKMLIPTPRLVDALVRQIPRGKVSTSTEIRRKLAEDFNVDLACPLATGWFIKIVVGAAEEELRMGAEIDKVAPYWRVVKPNGCLPVKYPVSLSILAERLRVEGVKIAEKRGKLYVSPLEDFLYKFS